MKLDLKSYYTAAKIAARFENAPKIEDVVLDTLFPELVRQTVETPVIAVSDITKVTGAVPVVSRGGMSIPLSGDNSMATYVEPLPVRVHDDITPVELNNLKLAAPQTLEQWARRKQEAIRLTARKTGNVLAAQAVFDGLIDYPLLQNNGSYVRYKVSYGDVLEQAVAAAEKWNHADASLMVIYKMLEDMATALDDAGYGGTKVTFAGKNAFAQVLVLIEATDKPKIPITIHSDGSINLGGHAIIKMAETYPDPDKGSAQSKIDPGQIRMVTKGNTALFYGPIDDLDANLQAMPLFIKPIKVDNPSKYTLVGESKPLPAVAPKATIKATVMA